MSYTVYILLCSDGSYYTGSTNDMQRRLFEHQEGLSLTAYTFRRRPVKLVWSEEVATLDDALLHEHQIKGWNRAKKEALIRGDFKAIHEIVRDERKRREKKGKRARVAERSRSPGARLIFVISRQPFDPGPPMNHYTSALEIAGAGCAAQRTRAAPLRNTGYFMSYIVYILLCSDGSYFPGNTDNNPTRLLFVLST